jgi:hypothetical protein
MNSYQFIDMVIERHVDAAVPRGLALGDEDGTGR